MEQATLGGGCFWCLEAAFEQVAGVASVVSGYCGGHMANPTYEDVCTGSSGHAEVVQITFDPEIISYQGILQMFFTLHDPTSLNRQGSDIGTQYRSAIFFHSLEQERTAREMIAALGEQGLFSAPMVTEVTAAAPFYPAEEYHQHYFRRNPGQGYCTVVVEPKVTKFRLQFRTRLKPEDR